MNKVNEPIKNFHIDVSFITLSYNRFDILLQSIESVRKNSRDITFEHIIVDNNSTEGDIFEVLKNYNHLQIHKNTKNNGWAAGINRALSMAKGEYICIVDNDVLFLDNVALKLLTFSKECLTETIVGPKILNEDLSLQNSISDFPNVLNKFFTAILFNKLFCKSKIFNPEHMNYKAKKVTEVDMLAGACLFFHNKLVTKLNGFEEDFFFYYADTDFCLRLRNRNGSVIYNPDIQVIHLGGVATGTSSNRGADHIVLDQIRFLRKHYPKFKRKLIYLLTAAGLFNRVVIYFICGKSGKKSLLHKSKFLKKQLVYFLKGINSYEIK